MELILIIIIIVSLYKIPTSSYESFGKKINDPFGFKEETRIKVELAMAKADHRKKLFDQQCDEMDVNHKKILIEHFKECEVKEPNKYRVNGESMNKAIERLEIELIELEERNIDNKEKR